MPRRFRAIGGLAYHVLNRGVRRSTLFDGPRDYCAFLNVLAESYDRTPIRILALTLMPNHWHMALWPREDGELTRFVGWASHTHACRWQRVKQTRGTGPVYQGRFQSIPVQDDHHLLTVLRYVERNAVRAHLVERAQNWPFSSISEQWDPDWPPIHAWPLPRPANWLDHVNEEEPPLELDKLRAAIKRSTPYGSTEWREKLPR